jgi:hypothetical protein
LSARPGKSDRNALQQEHVSQPILLDAALRCGRSIHVQMLNRRA